MSERFWGLLGITDGSSPSLPQLAAPLTDLTRKAKSQAVDWGIPQETAFQRLKELLIEMPVLRVADPTKPYLLQTYASERGLGARWMEKGKNILLHLLAVSCCLEKCTIQQLKRNA